MKLEKREGDLTVDQLGDLMRGESKLLEAASELGRACDRLDWRVRELRGYQEWDAALERFHAVEAAYRPQSETWPEDGSSLAGSNPQSEGNPADDLHTTDPAGGGFR